MQDRRGDLSGGGFLVRPSDGVVSCACGTARAISRECAIGVSRSASPQATRTGQRMSASQGRMSARAKTECERLGWAIVEGALR